MKTGYPVSRPYATRSARESHIPGEKGIYMASSASALPPSAPATPIPVHSGDFLDEVWTGTAQTGANFERGHFERCRFVRCVLTEAQFRGARFSDCVFDGCELSGLGVTASSFTGVRFLNCRMMGVNWTAADRLTFAASFESCNLDSSMFGGMRLQKFSFVECKLRSVDFTGCDLTNARFTRSDLGGALVRRATLTGADFGSAEQFRLDTRTNKTGKTKINLDTVAALMTDLGVVVPDLDALTGR